AGWAKCSIVLNDQIDDAIARRLSVSRKLLREIRALHRDRRHDPSSKSNEREKHNDEEKSDCFCAAKPAFAHPRHERIEQISKDGGDRDGNQNRLKKTNDA